MKKFLTIVTLSLAIGVFGSSIALANCNAPGNANYNCSSQNCNMLLSGGLPNCLQNLYQNNCGQPNSSGCLPNCNPNKILFQLFSGCNLPDFPTLEYPACLSTPVDPPVINPNPKPNEPTQPSQPNQPGTEEPSISLNEQEAEVVRLVNEQRAGQGLSALTVDANLQKVAQVRAQEQTTLFSHTRPNGTSCFTALDENDVAYMGAGENIAYGQTSAAQVMNDWMNSAGHKTNIMNPNFTKIGVGCYQDNNGVLYWAQEFIYE